MLNSVLNTSVGYYGVTRNAFQIFWIRVTDHSFSMYVKFSEKLTSLPPDTHTSEKLTFVLPDVCVSGGKKC